MLISGCSKLPPPNDEFITCTILNRIDSEVEWRQGACQNEQVNCFINCAITSELTADRAIQISLLNNPKIQAIFEQLGMARADLIEAGLLSNPSFEIEIRYPHIKCLKTNIEYLLTSALLDIFLIPLRTRLASIEYEQVKLKVSNEILNLAFDVRKTYYEIVSEKIKINTMETIVEITSIINEIASKQVAVGNINALEFQLSQARLAEAELELSSAQAEVIHLSEKLHALLGFTEDICFILPNDLPEIEWYDFDLCALENIAFQERLDLQIARVKIAHFSQMLGLKDWWTYTQFKGGVAGEKDSDGIYLIGPGFSGEVPIFNYGQAARMRLYAQLRQAKAEFEELEIQVLSEVRKSQKLLISYIKIIKDYQEHLLPMKGSISALSEKFYHNMGLGVDKLLEHKLQEWITAKNYAESLKKYYVSRVQLDRSLGGYLFKYFATRDCPQGVSQ